MNTTEFKESLEIELSRILDFWETKAIDTKNGGFVGQMNNHGEINYEAIKGGIYWAINPDLTIHDGRKQIYNLAFGIYGLSEYFKASKDSNALNHAIKLYEFIEYHGFDPINNGYFEAFSDTWNLRKDMRLSDKDKNEPKSMNTHLHLIESYLNLYEVWPNKMLKHKIENLLGLFENNIFNAKYSSFDLFFDESWQTKSSGISYGHNIEASWLLLKAAKGIQNIKLIEKWTAMSLIIAESVGLGLNSDGSLYHEFDYTTGEIDKHREWWVSAEAMLGYLNAYEISRNPKYYNLSLSFWKFIQEHLIDTINGEWFWGVHDDYSKMNEDKIGFWKCPYHTVRACIESINLLSSF